MTADDMEYYGGNEHLSYGWGELDLYATSVKEEFFAYVPVVEKVEIGDLTDQSGWFLLCSLRRLTWKIPMLIDFSIVDP